MKSSKNSRKGSCGQLFTMLRKNWLYTRRQWCVSIFEIVVPCLLMVLMAIIRNQIKLTEFPEQTFEDIFVIINTKEITTSTYIHYPLTYDPVKINHVRSERLQYDFMSRAAMGRFQFDPASCTKVQNPRVVFGLAPRNEFTEEILT